MRPRWTVATATPPAIEPVTAAEVMAYARLDEGNLLPGEEALIAAWIAAAREAAESFTGRSFVARTLVATLDGVGGPAAWTPGSYQLPVNYFDAAVPAEIDLPRGPVLAIDAVTTYDTANLGTAYDPEGYRLAGDRLVLNPSYAWPDGLRPLGGLAVAYLAGYGPNPGDVPQPIRTAIAVHAAALYDSRGQCDCAIPPACMQLLQPYRRVAP